MEYNWLLKQISILGSSCITFIGILVHGCFLLELLQRNEYRIDRLNDFFSTYQGKRTKLFYSTFLIMSGSSLILILDTQQHKILMNLLALFFTFLCFDLIKRVKEHRFLRPVWTKKTQFILLVTFSLSVASYIIFWMQTSRPINLVYILYTLSLTLTLSLIFLIFLTFSFLPITSIYKRLQIKKAKEKIKLFPELIIIGITGSYGKTSVKEYISAILSQKFTVLKTPEHVNTEIGVANLILKQLNKDHQIFVVEMGAYTKGEIKKICDMVHPHIGIITAINAQHLSLFGTQEAIVKAKKELIDSLPSDGLAILNADNQYTLRIFQQVNIPKESFSLKGNGTMNASHIQIDTTHISFQINSNQFTSQLKGEHTISNLLPCIIVAQHLGLNEEEIQNGLDQMIPPKQTLELKKGKNNMTIIDDSYNANPDGIRAALHYLSLFEGKKHFVMPSLRELGSQASEIHLQIAQEIASHVDYFYYHSKDFQEEIYTGFEKFPQKLILVESQKHLQQQLLKRLKAGDAILFESRGAQGVMESLLE